MGKEVRGVLEAPSLAAGVGHYLASQRRLRGISLDELAGLTKIPRRSLERLEAGIFDTASDGFVRGFVRAVALSLGLDPNEAVMRLMVEPVDVDPTSGSLAVRLRAGARKWLPGALALALAASVLTGLWFLVAAWSAGEPSSPPSDVILRRDPVRSLAGEAAPPPPPGDSAPAAP